MANEIIEYQGQGAHRAGDHRASDVKPLESQARLSGCQLTPFALEIPGKLAETCETVKKGARVLVHGKLDIGEYTDKEGQKTMTFRVLADTYRFLQERKGRAQKPPLAPPFRAVGGSQPPPQKDGLVKDLPLS